MEDVGWPGPEKPTTFANKYCLATNETRNPMHRDRAEGGIDPARFSKSFAAIFMLLIVCTCSDGGGSKGQQCLSKAPAITKALGAEHLCKCSNYGNIVRLVAGNNRHGLRDRSSIVLAIDRLAAALCADLILPPLASVVKPASDGTNQEVQGEWADYFNWAVTPANFKGAARRILKLSGDHLLIQHTNDADGIDQLENQYPRLLAPATPEELKKHIGLAFKLWSAGIKLSIDIPIDLYYHTATPACDDHPFRNNTMGHRNDSACGSACSISALSKLLHLRGCSRLEWDASLKFERIAEKITEGVDPSRFRVLHIRRGDTMKFGCDNSPPKVGDFVACQLENETSSQAANEKPELIIYFTDESDPTYHMQVVAELSQSAPHIIHGDKAARHALAQNNITDAYGVYMMLFTHHFEDHTSWSFGGHELGIKEKCSRQTTCRAARRRYNAGTARPTPTI
jgi:hypothetical protein